MHNGGGPVPFLPWHLIVVCFEALFTSFTVSSHAPSHIAIPLSPLIILRLQFTFHFSPLAIKDILPQQSLLIISTRSWSAVEDRQARVTTFDFYNF